ncbi:unnamed protein product [Staurois parvus]|uniref:Uncharacterized protein n=1 Tax=Staurois parvus TaxID=386267 RepID=A0ABN9H254_9NEOB|nr:unnamed protein product [Staurois parvus]
MCPCTHRLSSTFFGWKKKPTRTSGFLESFLVVNML